MFLCSIKPEELFNISLSLSQIKNYGSKGKLKDILLWQYKCDSDLFMDTMWPSGNNFAIFHRCNLFSSSGFYLKHLKTVCGRFLAFSRVTSAARCFRWSSRADVENIQGEVFKKWIFKLLLLPWCLVSKLVSQDTWPSQKRIISIRTHSSEI